MMEPVNGILFDTIDFARLAKCLAAPTPLTAAIQRTPAPGGVGADLFDYTSLAGKRIIGYAVFDATYQKLENTDVLIYPLAGPASIRSMIALDMIRSILNGETNPLAVQLRLDADYLGFAIPANTGAEYLVIYYTD